MTGIKEPTTPLHTVPLHVTVAVCTWNRSESLARTLREMTRLTLPLGVTWELLVVNNRSTDNTDDVIASFQDRLPIRRLWEPEPGLSNARNRALAQARGEYILWTDDDILVGTGWLGGYVRAFRQWPEADVFGGPIEPLFEGDPPDWIPQVIEQIGPVFGRQALGERPVALCPERVGAGPYGGNMAMRREALLRFPFNPKLGVRHGEYATGEETEVIRRMLEAGHTGWWTPDPLVRHWIPRESQSIDYVRRWMVGCGRYMAQSPEQGAARAHYRPHRLYARILRHEVGFRLHHYVAPPEVWIRNLTLASQAKGQLLAYRSAKRDTQP